uniref:Microtubule-associated protein futsch n=1 Tax=Mesocestoides corti TaxID=53468 RepID=A0A5K3FGE5_MESCO
MSVVSIILVVGETIEVVDRTCLLSHIKDGLSTIPQFETLKVNEILLSVSEPESISHDDFKFTSADASIILLQRPSVGRILEHLEGALMLLPRIICLVYSGAICQSSGHWILPSAVFKPSYVVDGISSVSRKLVKTLADAAKESVAPLTLHIACTSVSMGGEWRHVLTSRLPATIAGHPLLVSVNRQHPHLKRPPTLGAPAKPELAPLPSDIAGVEAFCQRVEAVLAAPSPTPACGPSIRAEGCSIRIQHPCLYVFPEGSGQSVVFALPGFSLMVNAGCSRDPTAWKMAQHLENIDAILLTHWGIDNTLGLTSLLPALMASSDGASPVPKVTCLLTPPPGHLLAQPPSGDTATPASADPLVVNVAKVICDLSQEMRPFVAESRLTPLEVGRGAKISAMPKSVPLYYKTGYGSLDLYPLTPTDEDQAEVKKLAELWTKTAPSVTAALVGAAKGVTAPRHAVLPLVSQLSVSALLIWRPARKSDALLRVLFVAPNAHQARVLLALEHLHVGLPCIHQANPYAAPTTTTAAAGGGGGAGSLARKPASTLSATSRKPISARPPATVANGVPGAHPNVSGPAPRAPPRQTRPKTAEVRKPAGSGAAAPRSAKPKLMANAHHPTTKSTSTLRQTPSSVKAPQAPPPATEKAAEQEPTREFLQHVEVPSGGSSSPVASPPLESSHTPVEEDLSGHDLIQHDSLSPLANDVSESGASKAASPTNNVEEKWPLHDGDSHLANEGDTARDSLEAASQEPLDMSHESLGVPQKPQEVSHEALDPLNEWGQPQAMPAPIAAAKPSKPSATRSASSASGPPEGYFEASAVTGGPGKAPYDKLRKTHVDVAFLPGAGDVGMVDAEFFKHVRARYYVATAVAPTPDLLKALAVGKESWNDNQANEVSLILAHDTPELLQWAAINEKRLVGDQIDLLTVAEHSTIQLVSADGDSGVDADVAAARGLACPGFRLDL